MGALMIHIIIRLWLPNQIFGMPFWGTKILMVIISEYSFISRESKLLDWDPRACENFKYLYIWNKINCDIVQYFSKC